MLRTARSAMRLRRSVPRIAPKNRHGWHSIPFGRRPRTRRFRLGEPTHGADVAALCARCCIVRRNRKLRHSPSAAVADSMRLAMWPCQLWTLRTPARRGLRRNRPQGHGHSAPPRVCVSGLAVRSSAETSHHWTGRLLICGRLPHMPICVSASRSELYPLFFGECSGASHLVKNCRCGWLRRNLRSSWATIHKLAAVGSSSSLDAEACDTYRSFFSARGLAEARPRCDADTQCAVTQAVQCVRPQTSG